MVSKGREHSLNLAEQESFSEAGDRAPNFALTDHKGEEFEFYTSLAGGPIVLVVASSEETANRPLLKALAKTAADFDAQQAHLFVVCTGTTESLAAMVADLDIDFPLLADPDESVTRWFLRAAGVTAPTAFVLDPNQRLVSVERPEGEDDDLPARALAAVKRIVPKGEPRQFTSFAPALIIPNVFSRDYCRHLIRVWENRGHIRGLVQSGATENAGKELDYGIKIRKDHLIMDPALEREIAVRLGPRIGPEVYKVYYYDNWTFEGFRIGCYEASEAGYFKPHRDNFNDAVTNRRYAITVNLNAEDYEGGDLRFPEYGIDFYRPPTGGAIVFSCSLLHEVVPVTKGRRFTFLTFLKDPPE